MDSFSTKSPLDLDNLSVEMLPLNANIACFYGLIYIKAFICLHTENRQQYFRLAGWGPGGLFSRGRQKF